MMILTQQMIDKLSAWQDAGNTFTAAFFPADINDFEGIKHIDNIADLVVGDVFDKVTLTYRIRQSEWRYNLSIEQEFDEEFEQLILEDMMDFTIGRFRQRNTEARQRDKGVA